MKAAVLREAHVPMEIEDITVSKPGPRDVLVRTKAVGICHSDAQIYEGNFPMDLPMVLGHESAGVVEQVGCDVRRVKPGDHVVTSPSVFCGACEVCLTGHMSLCTPEVEDEVEPRLSKNGQPIFQMGGLGSFAEQMLVHEHAVVKVRDDMPLDRAALIGCAVTTGVGAVIHTANVEVGTTVAVVGCGGVGLSCINGAAIAGASRIIAIDIQASKLDLAKQFGATHVVNAGSGDAVASVIDLTDGGVHYAFEAIGLNTTVEQAFQMLRKGGTATVIGGIPPGVMVSVQGFEFMQEKKIQGSFMGSNRFPVDTPRYVEFYLQGRLHLDDLITDRISLSEVNEGMAALDGGQAVRSVIMFD